MRVVLFAALVACVCASEQDATQFVKSVKGVHSNYQYKGGDTTRFFGYNNTNGYKSPQGYAPRPQVPAINFEVGVCYIEVPTASLVRDPTKIPAGNGSRSDLSRIRTCCEGYKRNIYNYMICEPACSKECTNGLCTAPETCSCFPDHVKNLAGYCVATCPIGCQNGHCSGGECLCKEGFKVDATSKFCVPHCKNNCGGVGNCTAPNTCECNAGYQTSPDGSCKVPCDNCLNGDCLEPNVCRCRIGYAMKNGVCEPQCNQNCGFDGRCVAPNVCGKSPDSNKNPGHQMHVYPPSPRPALQPNSYSHGPNPSHPEQVTTNPQYPVYPITHNISYPQYPGSQVTTTKPSSYGQQPQYPSNQFPQQSSNQFPQVPTNQFPQVPINQFPQIPTNQFPQVPTNQFPQVPSNQFPESPYTPNQGTVYPQFPTSYNVNISIPSIPLYPGNQFGTFNNTGQGGTIPQQPSNHYGGYPYPGNSKTPDQSQQSEYSPYNPAPQGPNSSSYQGYPQPTNPGPYQPQPFQPGQGTYGYRERDQFEQTHEVAPLCADGCINGVCVGYNQCQCKTGYIKDDDDPTGKRCEPFCPGGCPNGYCAAPHSCACNEGFHKDTSIKGRALCIKR